MCSTVYASCSTVIPGCREAPEHLLAGLCSEVPTQDLGAVRCFAGLQCPHGLQLALEVTCDSSTVITRTSVIQHRVRMAISRNSRRAHVWRLAAPTVASWSPV